MNRLNNYINTLNNNTKTGEQFITDLKTAYKKAYSIFIKNLYQQHQESKFQNNFYNVFGVVIDQLQPPNQNTTRSQITYQQKDLPSQLKDPQKTVMSLNLRSSVKNHISMLFNVQTAQHTNLNHIPISCQLTIDGISGLT